MAYRLQPHAQLETDLKRIATEQIDKAIDELRDPDGDRHEAIHDTRKRLKKLRGLIRLTRTGAPRFARSENARFRDIAKALSGTRDRTALIEAVDGLKARFEGEVETQSFAVVRTALELKRDAAEAALGDPAATVAETLDALEKAHGAVDGLSLPTKGEAHVLRGGLRANYARARVDLALAEGSGASDAFHDLRKRIKYLSMHLKLLEPAWPQAIAPMREEAEAAADDLGRDHDYAVLRAEMAADPESFGARADLDVVLALLDRHQSELRAKSIARCRRLLSEKPKAFAQRMDNLLAASRDEPKEAAPPEPPEAARRRA